MREPINSPMRPDLLPTLEGNWEVEHLGGLLPASHVRKSINGGSDSSSNFAASARDVGSPPPRSASCSQA